MRLFCSVRTAFSPLPYLPLLQAFLSLSLSLLSLLLFICVSSLPPLPRDLRPGRTFSSCLSCTCLFLSAEPVTSFSGKPREGAGCSATSLVPSQRSFFSRWREKRRATSLPPTRDGTGGGCARRCSQRAVGEEPAEADGKRGTGLLCCSTRKPFSSSLRTRRKCEGGHGCGCT